MEGGSGIELFHVSQEGVMGTDEGPKKQKFRTGLDQGYSEQKITEGQSSCYVSPVNSGGVDHSLLLLLLLLFI